MNLESAAVAVRLLGIEAAVEEKIDILYNRLVDEEGYAIRKAGGRKLSILATLLTTVNVFINYASSRQKLEAALAWLRQEWHTDSDQEAISLLGTMTLLYVINTGLRLNADDPKKVDTWTRFGKYVSDVEAEVLASAL